MHVIVHVHTIPRPPALLTALASSAYPTLGAFNIRHLAQASSEESSCGVPLHSTLDHGSCDRSGWASSRYIGMRLSLLIPNFLVRAVLNGILLAEVILHRS